jgi:hypothetical protein
MHGDALFHRLVIVDVELRPLRLGKLLPVAASEELVAGASKDQFSGPVIDIKESPLAVEHEIRLV